MMLRKLKTTASWFAVSGAMWFAGCSSSSPNQVAVTVSPTTALAVAGTVSTFSATVTGSTNIDSTWACGYSYTPAPTTSTPNPKPVTGSCTSGGSLNGGSFGTWTTNQSTVDNVLTYTAPTLKNFPNPIPALTFTATAAANNKKTGTATIILDSGIRVSVTPATATAPVGLNPAQQIQFTANLPSNAPTGLTWLVTQPVVGDTTDFPNGAAPGAPTCSPNCGSISDVGVYTAPATMPTDTFPKSSGSNAATAAITVTVVVNSPSDTLHFGTATITLVNASTNPITFNSISPTTIAAGGILQDVYLNAHNILNTTTITFTPPGTNQQAQAIDPSNIFTIPITANYCTPSAAGVTPVVACDASILTRIRLNQAQLAAPGTGQITVNNIPGNPSATPPCTATANSGGNTTNISCPVDLVFASPAMVTAVPDSFPQGNNANFAADGGYYGGGNSPIVNLLFNGNLNNATSFSARRFVGPLDGNQIQTPGLFPVSVVSNAPLGGTGDFTPPPFPQVWANVAVQPTFTRLNSAYFTSTTPPTQITTPPFIPLPVSGGNTNLAPSSIALDSAKGYAVITEQANNSIQIVNLTNVGTNGRVVPQMQGGPIAVGNAPTSIAIDNQINLQNYPGQDLGVVVNSGDNALTLVALPSGSIIGSPISLAGLIPGTTPAAPYAVGVDPNTHYAVVALNTSNIGYIVDVNPNSSAQSPACFNSSQHVPCAIATVSLNTGANPQVVPQPDAPLAYVTPGGSGVTSVVNLLQNNQSVAIAAAPNGAVRTNNVVTITTNLPNGLNQANPGTVLVAGVSPADFNGTFNVLTASTYTFTYTQNGSNETGGGGTVTFGNPYYTFSTTSTATGAAINPITRTLAFADPNAASNSQIGFIHTLDQTVTSLSLSKGSCNGCTPNPAGVPEPGLRYIAWDPFTNVLVAYNPQDNFNEISLINPGGSAAAGIVGAYRIIQAIQTGQTGTGSYTPSGSSASVTIYGPMTYDPKTNLVLVGNAGSNTLTYLDLDPDATFKKVEIQDIQLQQTANTGGVPSSQPPLATVQNPPPVATCDPTNPTNIYAACLPHGVTAGQQALIRILGQGFLSGGSPTVRLDGDATGVAVTNATDSEIDATIAASRLNVPHDFALDVVSGNVNSNTSQLFAIQVTPLPGCGTSINGAQPEGVAIDDIRNVAVVTNYGCNSVSFISLDAKNAHNYGVAYGSRLSTFPTGNAPVGVAVIPRLGYAVVTNNTDGTVTIINMVNPLTPSAATGSPVTVGVSPVGVAIDQDRALALVANSGGNSLSSVDLTTLELATPVAPPMQLVPVSGPPTAIAVDPNRSEAVVTNIQNTGATAVTGGLDVITLSGTVPTKSSTASISTLTANPTGIVYDPAVTPALFYVTSTQENAVYPFNPDTSSTTQIRVGINPFSLAYNYQTGTILTLNSTSNTMSVIDSQTFTTRETFGMTSQSQFGAAIDNMTNTAVIVDQNNNRVLIVAMPR